MPEQALLFPQGNSSRQALLDYAAQLPPEPEKQSLVQMLLNQTAIGGMLKDIGQAVTAPGDVYAGRLDPMSQEATERMFNLAGVATGGAGMFPSSGGSELRAGATTIKGLRDHLDSTYQGVQSFVSESPNAVTVSKVVVPPESRGKGTGTAFMNDIIEYADSVGKPVALTPSSDFGGKVSALERWYKSLGFVPNKGRNKDFSVSEAMIRPSAKRSGGE